MAGSDGTTRVDADGTGGLAPGQPIGGRYALVHRLGVGGMASVWLATDERLGRQVAIKLLAEERGEDDEFRQRFRREAKLAARLQHPNLVRVYDFNADERPYLVMEYVEGGTLAQRLASGDAPPVERLAQELLTALHCIHTAGILHRDVKPQNVLVDVSGHSRLTDFGIAASRDATSITRTGIVIGTETYMAPERRRGEVASERSDLYSLGVLLAEVAERDGAATTTLALIDDLRADDPEARPSSAAAALAALEQASPAALGEPTAPLPATELPPPPGATGSLETARSPDRRRQLAVAAIAAGLIVAVLAIGLALGGGDSDSGGGGASEDGGRQQVSANDAADEQPVESQSGGDGAASEPATDAPVDGAALDREGFALIEAGRYEEAIPVLQQAVEALRGSGDELNYNYALFNLAHALRLAGRPEEAIPLLEERLQYPDQTEVVEAELTAAREAAGIEVSGGEESGGTEVDDGGGPPPHAEANGQDE